MKEEPAAERTGGARVIVLLVLVALVVGLGIWATMLGLSSMDKQHRADDRAAASQAARQLAVNMMSVDAGTAQRDLDRIISSTTGEAKNMFAGNAKVFTDSVTKAKSKSTVSQVDAGVVSIDGDSAEIMVSVTSVVTSPQVPAGTPRPFRYLMDLTKSGDRWLVSKVEMVP